MMWDPMKRPNISWDLIAKAVDFYQSHGYQYIETPWFVSRDALNATLPADKEGQEIVDGYLVGSAEQGFVQLMLDDEIQPGKYVSVSPCHREDEEDELHQRSFMKVELIEIDPVEDWNIVAHDMALLAKEFFETILDDVEIVDTDTGYDILSDGIELGSYGGSMYLARYQWVYGTGLAEPRFSIAVEKALSKL